MVDGRWQAGKVTIDLNVGRSSRGWVRSVSLTLASLTPSTRLTKGTRRGRMTNRETKVTSG